MGLAVEWLQYLHCILFIFQGNMNDVSSAVLWTKLGMQHNLMNRLTSLVNNMSSQLLEKLLEEAITM